MMSSSAGDAGEAGDAGDAGKRPEGPRAVIAGHGGFAAGMISAVAQVSGLGGRYVPVSNTGLSPQALEEVLRTAVADSGATVIFTDLPAGSCTMAARRLARGTPGLQVVAGVALPTLLSFVCGSDLATATARGRDAIAIVEGAGGP
jgi:PTS system N-acetylgalactosamine-specific IIA component